MAERILKIVNVLFEKCIMPPMWKQKILTVMLAISVLGGMSLYFYEEMAPTVSRGQYVWRFLSDPSSDGILRAGSRCGTSPFLFPTDGLVGFIWDDSFRPGHRHQGIDIFAGTDVGVTPVMVAYPGYLSREAGWKSSLIVRVPQDPLQPGRQIWVYYTHMADAAGNSFISSQFPPGTSDQFVEAGTLLGYQGNYSGDPGNPVGVHLHISIVKDDGFGHYTNELDIRNTYDPSPYFGLALNAHQNTEEIPTCQP